ncbi:serine/threonine protein kinase, partial [Thermogutta sp.]|uniref:serine/threonine protein kinase n=1 Tax=Thermogutta sp. TaxID=1962930 RepID=UPI003C7BEE0F
PQQLGPYRIIRRLGRGGMGAVYEGVHIETGEPAAVKTLSEALLEEPDFRARFELEIETLRKLNHPNIVRLLGFGEENGVLFYVMELVRGPSLDQELKAGRKFTWREVTQIGIQVCHALKHAHDRGIIHRDLKPANLLRAEDGTIKLSDFGIARLFGAPSHTGAGSVLGTIEYMAPEQAEAQPIGPKADLYSLGAVLYALLVGRPPFKVTSFAQILHLHRTSRPDPVRLYVPDCPEELDRIIQELLQRDPDKRITNASLAARRLQAMLHALDRENVTSPVPSNTLVLPTSQPMDFGVGTLEEKPGVPSMTPTVTLPSKKASDESIAEASEFSSVDSAQLAPTRAAEPDELLRLLHREDLIGTPSQWQPTVEATAVQESPRAGAVETPAEPPPASSPKTGTSETSAATATSGRFVQVRPEDLDRIEPPPSARQPLFSLQTAILLGALVLLAGTIWYMLQPPSADQIYHRIVSRVGDGSDPDALLTAAPDIEVFLSRYSDDPRAGEIRDYQQEIDLLRMERKFELQARQRAAARTAIPIEQDYLEALRYLQIDPTLAMQKLEAILALYGHESSPENSSEPNASGKGPRRPVGHTEECLELVRRRLERLRRELEPAISNQRDLLEWRLNEADRIEKTQPELARKIREAVIELYGQKEWAQPFVERARRGLQSHMAVGNDSPVGSSSAPENSP